MTQNPAHIDTSYPTSEHHLEQTTLPPWPATSHLPSIQERDRATTPSTRRTAQHSAEGEYNLAPPPALDQSNLVNPVRPAPQSGWRRALHSMTGGRINPGDSAEDQRRAELLARVRQPLRGDYRIAVMSLKGGVGKTTTTVSLGSAFASKRGDRVIAVDANPDFGTLAQRVAAPGHATIRDLLEAEDTSRFPQVRAFTSQSSSRLEVIGSERDPAISEAFSEMDYRRAIDILQHHYNIILTDCGTGLMHSAMNGVLALANTLVLVTSPALDGAQSASATLDWLNLHGYEQLAANSVVVVSSAHPGEPTIDMDRLVEHFHSRTRAVHVIPFDRHLSEGALIDLERMSKQTQEAYLQLAAIVADDFGSWHRHAAH
jgi:MinD-like ATPase involved in chromosome partitioning or flagellar assembly